MEACEEGDFSYNVLSRYEESWKKLHDEDDLIKFSWLRWLLHASDKQLDVYHQSLKDSGGLHTDEFFEYISKSSRYMAKLIANFKKEGLDPLEFASAMMLFRIHFETYWDTLIQ